MLQIEGSCSLTNGTQDQGSPSQIDLENVQGKGSHQLEMSNPILQSSSARIAQLEKLDVLELGRAVREKQMNYYVAQGRVVRRVIFLFDNIEDLVAENDRWYEVDEDADHTLDQDWLQVGYITLTHTLWWFYQKGSQMEYDDYAQMLKMGADSTRGDDTSKLKALVSEWVNYSSMMGVKDCSAWLSLIRMTQRIHDRSDGYVVTDLSFPAFLYKKYTSNPDDLEEGLFKGKILLQSYKAVFTSPSSAKAIEGDGDGADIIKNNRHARKACFGAGKVKKHVAQIIKMERVTPHSITYIVCQVQFALSSINSWRSINGDFDYVQFWRTIVDFLKSPQI
ncbi:hypothetical protein EDD22DRAFT_958866 [Suillus occidentalis]|nr:hypothetical protein EDD22DRAFT_958866 [Suillus occidentalis]